MDAEQAKILVVDDIPQNVKLLVDLLTLKGYAVVTASSGEEALAKVASENGGKGVWTVSTAEDLDGLTDMCEAYLAKRHCVLWGEPFEIITPKGRRQAAEWLAAQIAGLGFQGDQAPG